MCNESMHKALLNKSGNCHLYIFVSDQGVTPYEPLVGAELPGAAWGRGKCRFGRRLDSVLNGLHEERVGLRWPAVCGWIAGQPAFKTALNVGSHGEEMGEVECCCFAGGGILRGNVCQEECLSTETPPEKWSKAVGKWQKETLFKQPRFVSSKV